MWDGDPLADPGRLELLPLDEDTLTLAAVDASARGSICASALMALRFREAPLPPR